jgi:hypothetical protein
MNLDGVRSPDRILVTHEGEFIDVDATERAVSSLPHDALPRPHIIGLVGRACAGKDTVAGMMDGYERIAFADPVRAACVAVFDAPLSDFVDRGAKERVDPRWGISPREMMQRIGTDCVRNRIGDDHWIDHMRHRMKSDVSYVVTDVRFLDEARFLKSKGAALVRVIRPSTAPASPEDHVSETEGIGIECDHCILNDSTTDALRRAVDEMMRRWV